MEDNSKLIEQISGSIKSEKQRREEAKSSINYVNFDDIDLEDTSVSDQKNTIENIFGKVSTTEVVCIQSGYSATMSALNYKDILTITNSSLSSYETKKNLFNTVYDKIVKLSFSGNKKPKFEDWMKITSYGDLETLLYGIYCSTFQEKSSISFRCPHCDKDVNVTILNQDLIQVEDNENTRAEISDEINEISLKSDSMENMMNFSLVSVNDDNKKRNIKNIKLSEKPFIFSIKLPTLNDVLHMLKIINESVLASLSADISNILLLTNCVYVQKDNKKYFPVGNKNDILKLINSLTVDDIGILKTAVYELLSHKHIYYEIKKQKCPNCGKDIFNISMDIENLLFFQISEKQLI